MSSPHLPLADRVALIAGVSRPNGIGFAVARRLGSMGATLFLHGWPPDNARYFSGESGPQQCTDALRAEGIDVRYMEADFMDPAAPESVVLAAVEAYGQSISSMRTMPTPVLIGWRRSSRPRSTGIWRSTFAEACCWRRRSPPNTTAGREGASS